MTEKVKLKTGLPYNSADPEIKSIHLFGKSVYRNSIEFRRKIGGGSRKFYPGCLAGLGAEPVSISPYGLITAAIFIWGRIVLSI